MTQKIAPSPPPLFRLPPDRQPDVPVLFEGRTLLALTGETVASLLLRHVDAGAFRREERLGEARAPLCLMGVCFDCLVTIDGQENQQSCLIAVAPGMRIARQLTAGGDQ